MKWKTFLLLAGSAITIPSLSVLLSCKSRIGQNSFMPLGVKSSNPFERVFIRLVVICFVFIYVRVFFVVDALKTNKISSFDSMKSPWELFIDTSFPLAIGSDVFFYYYSFTVAVLGVVHLILIEIYFKNRTLVSQKSLGESLLFRGLKGKHIFNLTIDNFFINCVIEPALFLILGYLFFSTTQYKSVGVFLVISGVAMILQAQFSRMNFVQKEKEIDDAEELRILLEERRNRKRKETYKSADEDAVSF